MSDENIKGIPEEETAELTEETADEAVEETIEEPAEDISEELSEEPSEVNDAQTDMSEITDEEIPAEESEEEISDDSICLYCGENKKQEESDYCAECEAAMLARKIPFLAWIGGLVAVVFSVFALAIVFLLTAPSIQVAKGDSYAREKRWYSAYTAYSDVPAVVDEITTILGGESPFVQAGTNIAVKKFDALAHYTSPLEAFYYESQSVSHLEGKFNPTMKGYYEIYNDYMSSYDIVLETLETKFGMTEPSAEEMHAAVEDLRGTEGVSDIWIDYYHLTFAYNFNESDEAALKYLKAIDESAKKSKLDYSWLYYTELSDLLYKMNDYEGSTEYLDKLIKNDRTNFGAYELKMRITLKTKGLEEAKKLLDEFIEYNEGIDTAYVLRIMYLRAAKEYDKALELCVEAQEEFATAPELYRQEALIHLLKGEYGKAYEAVFTAYSNASYIAQYYQDDSSLTNQLYNTLYLCSYLESEKGSMNTDNASEISNIINDLKDYVNAESVLDVINGKKTVEQVLTEGEYDLV
ncbi:MAG: hypothetical protein IKK63_02250 [Clostridia bacterium]|nr:hypothetical protein [Clostridia bacterium]